MQSLLFLVIIIVIVVVIKRKNDAKNVANVSNGKYDAELAKLENYYSIIRENADGLGVGVICISTYFFVLDGRVDSSSSFLAVSVRNVANIALAKQLGMDVANLNGELEYRFILKGKFGISTKRAILSEMSNRIAEKYPNDVLKYDNSIPALFCSIDVKNIMNMMGN